MNKILITGGSGLIGSHLQQKLKEQSYNVVVLSRNPKKENEFRWNISENYIDDEALKNVDYIIHLAGAGIADKRWTDKRKKELINSRVKSANLLFNKIKELNIPLKGFISASGIGYYGAITSETLFNEDSKPENDFIAEICIEWERAANQFQQLDIPVTILRTGVVLSQQGGALSKLNTPLFLASLGSGKQFMPWIHIDDLSNLYINALKDKAFTGVFNAVTPEHKTNESFVNDLSKALKKPVFPINIPSFFLKVILGELACILLEGSKVSAKKTSDLYTFVYPNLKTALANIYKR